MNKNMNKNKNMNMNKTEESPIEDIYKYLKEKGYFKDANINKYGHRSYMKKEKILLEENPLEVAWKIKKEADSIYYNEQRKAYRKWLESLLLYIQGSERNIETINGLVNFAKSIIKFINQSDTDALNVFQTVCLSLEYFVQKISPPSLETQKKIDIIIVQAFTQKTQIIPIDQIVKYIVDNKDKIYYN